MINSMIYIFAAVGKEYSINKLRGCIYPCSIGSECSIGTMFQGSSSRGRHILKFFIL
jgi:hypothetical protein